MRLLKCLADSNSIVAEGSMRGARTALEIIGGITVLLLIGLFVLMLPMIPDFFRYLRIRRM